MSICDSEENRKKLAWLVPGYILLAWFFCVLFQPLGIRSPGSNRYHPRLTKYGEQVIYLTSSEDIESHHCRNNGSSITLEEGQRSAVVIRLGRIQHHMKPFICTMKITKGKSLDGLSAYVEELDLPEYHDDTRKPGGHWGSFVCHDYLKLWTGEPTDEATAEKLCGRWSAYDHEGHGAGALETVPLKAMVDSCQDNVCTSDIFLHIEMDGGIIDGHGAPYGLSLRQRKDFVIVFTGYKKVIESEIQIGGPEASNVNETESLLFAADNATLGCSQDEFQCQASDFDDRHVIKSEDSSGIAPPRCIWSKLRCDYHQNCGAGHESDESGCGYLRRISGIHERLSPWSVSTMSLLIIVYLAIVLILVLVTMLLLRWHKVLRTPLDVLSDSRVHQSPPMIMEDRELAAAAAAAAAANSTTPATVSIMVMYRPNKPRGFTQPSTVELPPSYESLFMGESPPSYNVAASDEAAVASALNSLDSAETPASQSQTHAFGSADATSDDSHCDCDCDHSRCNNALTPVPVALPGSSGPDEPLNTNREPETTPGDK